MHLRSWFQRFRGRAEDRECRRVVAVLGMHRSGTSAVTRGLQALGVYLGNDFLDAQPENPTGYWEDKGIVDLNERVLEALGSSWDDSAAIHAPAFDSGTLRALQRTAARYVRRTFGGRPLWGFKDPRTLRVLPLWLGVFEAAGLDDAYLLVIRNPMSIAKSLFARRQMPLEDALRLWLAYSMTFFGRVAGKTMVVVDYDRFMLEPRRELQRIARGLRIGASSEETGRNVDRFAEEFLDEGLRHTTFSLDDIDTATPSGRVARDAYALLLDLASDRRTPDDEFWKEWRLLGEGMPHG